MRFLIYGILLVCAICLSCNKDSEQMPPEFYEALQLADNYENGQATQACHIFERLAQDTTHMSEEQKMYFLLKWIYVKDKEGNSSINLQHAKRVATYYEENGPDSLLMESYYYLGGAYRDKNDGPRAVHWYAKALQVAKEDSTLLHHIVYTRICLQMGIMYNHMLLADKAIKTYRKALKGDSDEYLDQIYYLIAVSFNNLGMQDSTLHYLIKAYNVPNMSKRSRLVMAYSQLPTLYDLVESNPSVKNEIEKKDKRITRL